MPEQLLNKAQICNVLKIKNTTLDNYIKSGMPVAKQGGQGRGSYFDLDVVTQWMAENVKSRNEQIAEVKLRDAIATAALKELELQKARGELIPIAEVGKAVEREYTNVRSQLQAIPDKASGILQGLDTQIEKRDYLKQIIRDILEELSLDTQYKTNARKEADETN